MRVLRTITILLLCAVVSRAAEIGKGVDQSEQGVLTFATDEPSTDHGWQFKATRWGMYFVEVACTGRDEAMVRVDVGGRHISGTVKPMDDVTDQPSVRLGRVYIEKAGANTLTVKVSGSAEVRGVKLIPAPEGERTEQAADGSVLLHSRDATVHGTMLRYEPKPEKNTLGYWVNVTDHATWDFELHRPGRYTVEVLQGCGAGQGGSEAAVIVGDQTLNFTVQDTGHFQDFVPREIGVVQFKRPGRHTLKLTPLSKAAKAVMDVRQVRLIPTP